MDNESEKLCTIKEACLSEKAGRTTIHKRINAGIYKKYKIGGSTRLSVASILAYRKLVTPPVAKADPAVQAGGDAND